MTTLGDMDSEAFRLRGRYALRLAVEHIRAAESHIARTWALLRERR